MDIKIVDCINRDILILQKNIKRLYFLFKKIFCILNWKYLIKSLSRYLILKDDIMIIFTTIWEIEEKMITFYSLYKNHNYSCPSTLIAFSSNTFCSILIFLFSNVLFITSTVFVLHKKNMDRTVNPENALLNSSNFNNVGK